MSYNTPAGEAIEPGVLNGLYPDIQTRVAISHVINLWVAHGEIGERQAIDVLLLGEPAVYGAMAAIRDKIAAQREIAQA